MNTELDKLIANAFKTSGAIADVNKVYLTFLKTTLYVPADIHENSDANEEPFTPLFSIEEDCIFMLAFDSLDRFRNWAGEEANNLNYVTLVGKDLITGIGENVSLALNPGYEYYKEFSPEEIKHLKFMIAKVTALTQK